MPRRQGRFWSRLHFLIRFLGLTGLLVACVGLVLLQLLGKLASWQTARDALLAPDAVAWLVIGGAAAAVVALLVELIAGLTAASARRSIFGLNAVVQVALAVALLVGVNAFTFLHPLRFDWTRQQEYTLPTNVANDLRRVSDETTVVIYQRHKTTADVDKPDRYDFAAERKVVEKVKDLVQQLRELGPRFRVETLDVEQEGYDDTLKDLTKDAPELRAAIEAATENTLFFHSKGRVQSMSFNEFYRLQKVDSRDADGGRGNLVLGYAGPQPVADRILNLETHKPRVGVLVAHEALTTEGPIDHYTLAGLRKTLTAHGFEVRDIVLRLWDRGAIAGPAVDRLDDTKYVRLRKERDVLEDEIEQVKGEVKELSNLIQEWPSAAPSKLGEDLTHYAQHFDPDFYRVRGALVQLPSGERLPMEIVLQLAAQRGLPVKLDQLRLVVDDARRAPFLDRLRSNLADSQEVVLDVDERNEKRVDKQLAGLDEGAVAARRQMSDLRAKLERDLDDCDLLVIPQETILPEGVPLVGDVPRVFDLTEGQAAAIREFMSRGKPVMACLGPRNQPSAADPDDPRPRLSTAPPGRLEKMFAELGAHFSDKTVLYNAQRPAFAENDDNIFRAREPLDLPPLALQSVGRADEEFGDPFGDAPGAAAAFGAVAQNPWAAAALVRAPSPTRPTNPVSASLGLRAHAAGRPFDLTLTFPRAVTLDHALRAALPFDPDLLTTDSATWNDEAPFPTPDRPIPRYTAPDLSHPDPDRFTPDARRRGPFTVGAIFETDVPKAWRTSEADAPARLRAAAIGHGGVFIGQDLAPAQQDLLLDTCNWLLGRQDRLAQPTEDWRYPRVELSDHDQELWLWGARLGLPLLFAYLGAVVLLWRGLR